MPTLGVLDKTSARTNGIWTEGTDEVGGGTRPRQNHGSVPVEPVEPVVLVLVLVLVPVLPVPPVEPVPEVEVLLVPLVLAPVEPGVPVEPVVVLVLVLLVPLVLAPVEPVLVFEPVLVLVELVAVVVVLFEAEVEVELVPEPEEPCVEPEEPVEVEFVDAPEVEVLWVPVEPVAVDAAALLDEPLFPEQPAIVNMAAAAAPIISLCIHPPERLCAAGPDGLHQIAIVTTAPVEIDAFAKIQQRASERFLTARAVGACLRCATSLERNSGVARDDSCVFVDVAEFVLRSRDRSGGLGR
jgi:hypothetical protein